MALLLPSHSVSIYRPTGDDGSGGYGATPTTPLIASGQPASIVRYSGQTTNPLDAQLDTWLLLMDSDAPLLRYDVVVDEASGQRYRVEDLAVRNSGGPFAPLDHTRATLKRSQA